jgi:hypothetical protein
MVQPEGGQVPGNSLGGCVKDSGVVVGGSRKGDPAETPRASLSFRIGRCSGLELPEGMDPSGKS